MPAAATLTGLGTVNLARSGAGAASNAVTIDNTTFGSGVKALNLTNAGNLTTAAGVDITLNSATSVSVNNAAATKYTTVAVTDTSTTAGQVGSTLTTVSITGSTDDATLTGNAITTVNLNGAATGAGKTVTVTAAAATRALTVNVSGTTASGNLTDGQATTATLNQTAAATMGTLTVAKATTVNINTTGVATTAGAETLAAAKMTTLNISGTRANTVTAGDYSALTNIVVTGTGGVTLGNLSAIATLTSVDTSGATNVASATGATNLTVANSVQLGINAAFTGGAGSDSVTVGATTKAINLGTGANTVTLIDGTTGVGTGGSITGDGNDTLAFATAANAFSISGSSALSTAFKAAVTGFSTVSLAAIGNNTVALDVTKLSTTAITNLNLAGNGATVGALTVSNLGSGATIKVTGANGGGTTTTAGTTGSGTSDVLNISLSQGTNTAVNFGTFETPNVENINFITADTQATPTGTLNTVTLTNSAIYAITVSGNNGLNLGTVLGATNLQSFNASGVTLGGVGITSAALQYASTVVGSAVGGDTLNFNAALAAVNITTTAGTNYITGSNTIASTFTGGTGVDNIYGGSGADVINAGAGADLIYADNAGAKRVEKYTITTAGDGNASITINGVTTTVTYATSGDNTIGLLQTALAADARYGKLFTSAVTVNGGTTTDDVLTVTWLADGTNIGTATTSTNTLAINTTGTNGTAVNGTQVTAGVAGATANNVITGGAGADTFIFGVTSVAPSATVFDAINDFASASDAVMYSKAPLSIVTNATASAGTAAISSNGIATFNINDTTLAQRIAATEAGINAGGNAAAGQMAVFQFGSDAYAFISNGTDGVGAGDLLIKLVGVDSASSSFDVVTITGNSFTLV